MAKMFIFIHVLEGEILGKTEKADNQHSPFCHDVFETPLYQSY